MEVPKRNQVTYRHPGQPSFEPPWLENNYAQIDYILTKTRWKSSFVMIKTLPNHDYDSDHLPMQAILHHKWKFGSPKPTPKPDRHIRKCEGEALRQYNDALRHTEFKWTTLQDTLRQAALQYRGIQPPTIRLPYLQPTTIDLLRTRDAALTQEIIKKQKFSQPNFEDR